MHFSAALSYLAQSLLAISDQPVDGKPQRAETGARKSKGARAFVSYGPSDENAVRHPRPPPSPRVARCEEKSVCKCGPARLPALENSAEAVTKAGRRRCNLPGRALTSDARMGACGAGPCSAYAWQYCALVRRKIDPLVGPPPNLASCPIAHRCLPWTNTTMPSFSAPESPNVSCLRSSPSMAKRFCRLIGMREWCDWRGSRP